MSKLWNFIAMEMSWERTWPAPTAPRRGEWSQRGAPHGEQKEKCFQTGRGNNEMLRVTFLRARRSTLPGWGEHIPAKPRPPGHSQISHCSVPSVSCHSSVERSGLSGPFHDFKASRKEQPLAQLQRFHGSQLCGLRVSSARLFPEAAPAFPRCREWSRLCPDVNSTFCRDRVPAQGAASYLPWVPSPQLHLEVPLMGSHYKRKSFGDHSHAGKFCFRSHLMQISVFACWELMNSNGACLE